MNAWRIVGRFREGIAAAVLTACVAACLVATSVVDGTTVAGSTLSPTDMASVWGDKGGEDWCRYDLYCGERIAGLEEPGVDQCEEIYCHSFDWTSICCECGCRPSGEECYEGEGDPIHEWVCTGNDRYKRLFDPGVAIRIVTYCDKPCHEPYCDGMYDSTYLDGTCITEKRYDSFDDDECPCEIVFDEPQECYICPKP